MILAMGIENGNPVALEKMKDVENDKGELVVDLVGSICGHTVAPVH